MEQATLLKIAQFRTLAARKGKAFDVVRFATDSRFAKTTLTEMLAECDEELMAAGLVLMAALGMVERGVQPQAAPALPAPTPPPAKATLDNRYVGRLR